MMISAIVLTKNEELRQAQLERCLKSLQWCDEIIVVDDDSTDKTVSIAKQFRAKFFERKLNNNFSQQRNFGLNKAKHDWVLFIDADEEVSPALKKEIQLRLKNHDSVQGYYFKRQDYFWGQRLRFGETSRVRLLRLAQKTAGKWQGSVHEVWQIKGETGQFKNPLTHQRQITVADFLTRINRYSSIRAKELYDQGKKSNWLTILAYPVGKFLYNFCWRWGWLDGRTGFVMALLMSIHSFLVRAKLYLLWQNQGQEEFPIPSMSEINQRYG